ncbi:long chain acyl-CoA synthetase 4-like [Rhododendron vialii]|uniref:long chain acyl-CoA synthetase 4-like n=1 Tax=Rhododendron vialii TaxID=182163 RepID=UPI00265F1128|nr:long chain acyl-CoA synthetase 4-like [Rhododendron vialii]
MAPLKTSKVSSMSPAKRFVVEVTDSPTTGPVYRSAIATEGPLVQGGDTCWDNFRMSVDKYPNNSMLGQREILNGKAGKYVWLTYKEVYDTVMKLGNSIRSCGVEDGGRCGIYGANCSEWVISMQACNAHRLTCVPLYDTLGANAVEYIINHAEVTIAFAHEKKVPELLKTFPNTTKYLKTIVSFGDVTPEQREEVKKFGLALYTWHEFLVLGENKQYDLPAKKKSDICTIMYTSGTTGDPKGVMITNNSIINVVVGMNRVLQENVNEPFNEKDVYFSYLPLAHIFDRVIEEILIRHGGSIGFWRGDVKLLTEDLGALKPSIFCAVPRVLDMIYTGLKNKISSGSLVKRSLFDIAYRSKLDRMKKGMKHTEAAPNFDKIVFSKVKQALGGNVRLIICGAAPLARHVETFFRVTSCAYVIQGYGLTETCAGSFLATPDVMNMTGTVGSPVPNVEVRLESVFEMGYDALASTPRGEICMKGETVFSGYYKREDLTKEVLVDGWFHTGDVGEWQPDGSMKIIDRKKNIFKLAQGEYVAVEKLESVYGGVPGIDSIWVYGNSFESFLIAVLNPNKAALERWAEENGIPTRDFNSLCENPRAKAYVLGELAKVAREKKLKGFEFIKAVHLDPVPFNMDRDLLTPTFKKKRPQLLKYYQNTINNMYESTGTNLQSMRQPRCQRFFMSSKP